MFSMPSGGVKPGISNCSSALLHLPAQPSAVLPHVQLKPILSFCPTPSLLPSQHLPLCLALESTLLLGLANHLLQCLSQPSTRPRLNSSPQPGKTPCPARLSCTLLLLCTPCQSHPQEFSLPLESNQVFQNPSHKSTLHQALPGSLGANLFLPHLPDGPGGAMSINLETLVSFLRLAGLSHSLILLFL